jgi:hypothetical protein
MSEPIEVNGPWDDDPASTPEGPPAWNRAPGKTAAEANLDGAPHGFKVTGDAAWDSGSDDYAVFSAEGNAAVAAMVKTARLKTRSEAEGQVLAWLEAEKERLAADEGQYLYLPHLREVHDPADRCEGMSEIRDTMVRETIAYALDEAWTAAYGHSFGDEAAA